MQSGQLSKLFMTLPNSPFDEGIDGFPIKWYVLFASWMQTRSMKHALTGSHDTLFVI